MAITNYPEYPKEQIEWLKEYYPTHSMKDTHKAFNEHFGLELSMSSIKHRCCKFGIKTAHDGRFKKGGTAWNKDIDLKTERPDIYEQFVSGSRYRFHKGHIPKCTRPVGSEKVYRDVVMIKVAMPNVWQVKARYVYEQAHNCKLEKKDKILHLNGDCQDCNIENLVKVSDAVIVRLNKQGLRFTDSELTKNAVLREQILEKVRELEKNDRDST